MRHNLKEGALILVVCIVGVTLGIMLISFVHAGASKGITKSVESPPSIAAGPDVTIEPIATPEPLQPLESVEIVKIAEVYQAPSQPTQQKQQMEHIPFTQKKVTAGDPESYIDTVGQCPFHEMGGPKGCSPPSDIKCNADWSKCEYIGERFSE